jgi:hypothetical protein
LKKINYPKNRKPRPRKTHCVKGHLRSPENLKADGLHCRLCHVDGGRQYRTENRERLNAEARERRAPGSQNDYKRLRRYGLTPADYVRMLADQDDCCAICGAEFLFDVGVTYAPNIDHCHVTGRVRGLLCGKCNRGIGMLRDDATLLRNALEYIEAA